jgi:hypothetical protein
VGCPVCDLHMMNIKYYAVKRSHGSSVSIVNRLGAGRSGFNSWQSGIFSPFHCVQTGSGANSATYPVGTSNSFPWGLIAGM